MSKNPKIIDMSGLRFGLWLVLKQDGNSPRGAALWLSQCDCGTTRVVTGYDLRSGKSASCGCTQKTAAKLAHTTHGGSKTRLHRIWKGMRTRCNNPNIPGAKNYSERGIDVCDEWDCFDSFRAWAMANGYRDDLSIERVDVDAGYNPKNCTWANSQTQNVNRRFVLKDQHGEAWSQIAKAHGIPVTLMHGRIHEGWPIDKAATLPKGSRIGKMT